MYTLKSPEINTELEWTRDEFDFMELHKEIREEDIFGITKKFGAERGQKIIHQLFSRKNLKEKLPFLYNNPSIIYPVSVSHEQSSSERTAQFKASLFKGESFIDLSCGMGIDSYFFAQHFKTGILVEKNEMLGKITSHNFAVLNQSYVQFAIGVSAEDFLKKYTKTCDLIYLDPSRRNEKGGKVFKLSDCEPNVVSLLPELFLRSQTIVIKTSPLLDIQAACNELQFVKNIYVVAIDNECKELIFHLEKGFTASSLLHALNFEKEKQTTFSFNAATEKEIHLQPSEIKKYIYEPNAAILKAGGFKSVSVSYDVKKLHAHSHLYTSDKLIENFPGRRFEVLYSTKVDKKVLKEFLPEMKANLSIRNFPGSVHDLQKKLGLKDGGTTYIFATTDYQDKKVLLITQKI